MEDVYNLTNELKVKLAQSKPSAEDYLKILELKINLTNAKQPTTREEKTNLIGLIIKAESFLFCQRVAVDGSL